MPLTKVTYSMIDGESVNIVDYIPNNINPSTTDVSAYIQAAIDESTGGVYIPDGIYLCGNILMKTGLHLYGQSHNAVLKLVDNAYTKSVNGSVAESGIYPGNVICSTLQSTGGTWYDNGTRAKDPNNSTYIYENVIIENLTIDGNKANNNIGEAGANGSAMNAGISIHQCKNVTVRNCRIINNNKDGIHVGYTLHGGSDYCTIEGNYFAGNQRTNIAMITGKYNTVCNNTGTDVTGGPVPTGPGAQIGALASLDIEANFDDEINYRHSIVGNRLGGAVGVGSAQEPILYETVFSGNVWNGDCGLGGALMTQGVTFSGDTFIANPAKAQAWLSRGAEDITNPTNLNPTVFTGCTIEGFERLIAYYNLGQQGNLLFNGCSFKVGLIGEITRGYNISFNNCNFELQGSTDTFTIKLTNTLGATVTTQGQIQFTNNRFVGTSNSIFLWFDRDSSWSTAESGMIFDSNYVSVTGASYSFNIFAGVTIKNNAFENFKPIQISSISNSIISNNEFSAPTSENLFVSQSGTFNNIRISDNDFENIVVDITRPKYCQITKNRFYNGYINITYSFTSTGVGSNHVAFNSMTATTTTANPFVVSTGSSFSGSDFVGNDQYKYNTYVGYTSGANIAAGMSGHYDGSFS